MSHSTLCKWEMGRNLICILEKSNPKTDFAIWSHAQERASRSGFEALSCACDFSLRESTFHFWPQKNVEFELPNSVTKVSLNFFEMSNATQKILADSMWIPTFKQCVHFATPECCRMGMFLKGLQPHCKYYFLLKKLSQESLTWDKQLHFSYRATLIRGEQ